jgi:hypothetical protein
MIKWIGSLAAALWGLVLLPASASSEGPPPSPPQLHCNTGPVTKTYGGTKWLVYSCDDNRTIVIVSAPGSPAMPFYFVFYPTTGGYRLEGEGTGNKGATDAAVQDLRTLSEADIAALIAATKPR